MFKRQHSKIVFLLFIAGAINYLDRAAFSVAMPYIKEHLGLDPVEIGFMLSSFFFGYALFNFVGGYLSDRYGPGKVFATAMVSWSLFCGLTGVAFSYVILFIIRVLFGMSEGPMGTTVNKTVSNWVPLSKRVQAVGIANAGNPLGGAIAGPIVGFIAVMWNWRISFFIMMCLGFIWTFFWLKAFTDHPRDNPHTSKAEVEEYETSILNQAAQDNETHALPLREYLKKPMILSTAMAFFAINYILYFFLTWFPSYLSMSRGLNIQQLSIASSIPWIIGSIGMALGGVACDVLYKKTNNLIMSRKAILVIALMLSSLCLIISAYVQSLTGAVTMMALGIFFMYLAAAAPWALVADNVSSNNVGSVGGFIHLIANTAGVIAPILTGFIVQYTGNFIAAFILTGVIGVIGALCVAIFVRVSPLMKSVEKSPT